MNDQNTKTTLMQDLVQYADEVHTKGDVEAGFKLLQEVAGAAFLGGFLLTALTVWIPGIGLCVAPSIVVKTMYAAAKSYNKLDADQRKSVRAAISWLKKAVGLGEQLIH